MESHHRDRSVKLASAHDTWRADAPVKLDASSGVFQGELAFPLTASTWSVSLRVTSPNEVRIVPVAVGMHYRDTGMVSWDPVSK